MYIICYRYNGTQHYVEYESVEDFYNDFKEDAPDLEPDYIFHVGDNLC